MLIGSNRGAGGNQGFPDVCNTPAGPATAPVPYPNIAMNAQATPFSPNVYLSQCNALNMSSVITMSSGDEGGVAHPTIKGPSQWTTGNPIVQVNAMPAINAGCPSTSNMANDGVGAQAVPSVTNVMFTYARSTPHCDSTQILSDTDLAEYEYALRYDTVHYCMLAEGVGYIQFDLFGWHIPEVVSEAIRILKAQGMKSLVIDVRGNRGGALTSSLKLASQFIPMGSPICRFSYNRRNRYSYVMSMNDQVRHSFSCYVVVDKSTASAAEVFAGALNSSGRHLISTADTFGKLTTEELVVHPGSSSPRKETIGTISFPSSTSRGNSNEPYRPQ